MPGAYVAKPAVVSTPDVPPGWDSDWPVPGDTGYDPDPFFPAPYPPGYTPALSLVVTATESIAYNGTAAVGGSARDHGTYATNEPSAITWTAMLAGAPVSLRLSGESSYSAYLSSAVSFGTYWGATPAIEFDVDEDNIGDTVILTGHYTLDDTHATQSASVELTDPLATITVTFSGWSLGGSGYGVSATLRSLILTPDEDYWVNTLYKASGFTYTINRALPSVPATVNRALSVSADGHSMDVRYGSLSGDNVARIYVGWSDLFGFGASVTASAELVIGETTYEKTIADGEPDHWLDIRRDGSVDMINP